MCQPRGWMRERFSLSKVVEEDLEKRLCIYWRRDPVMGCKSEKARAQWWQHDFNLSSGDYSKLSPIIVVTDFIASSEDGVPTTLKRSGSDYSATIFASLLNAEMQIEDPLEEHRWCLHSRPTSGTGSISNLQYEL